MEEVFRTRSERVARASAVAKKKGKFIAPGLSTNPLETAF
ncbi:hypothetical protein ACPOL_4649 [Acidisarcina polymorpha]|uniref:Uncharacterized protein n=1 Tax=Acidisarcina polymorpha TaxID=2211140 RepID=A0A2Z5G4G8_9BACT|nr:hypothetical protein ACPOL_4649 [Acidisarcina polymorpha]